jgi:hypothetical protein
VSFDERRYIASAPELRQPIVALSLGGLRRRIEALLLPDNLHVVLHLDRAARRERNRRRQQPQLRCSRRATMAPRGYIAGAVNSVVPEKNTERPRPGLLGAAGSRALVRPWAAHRAAPASSCAGAPSFLCSRRLWKVVGAFGFRAAPLSLNLLALRWV